MRLHLGTILAFVLGLSGHAVVAQSPTDDGLGEVRTFFREGLNAPTAEDRCEAVNALVLSNLPEGIPLMIEALGETLKRKDRLHRRYRSIGQKLSDLTRKRLRISTKAQRLEKERDTLGRELGRDEKVIAALRAGLGRLFQGLPPDDQPPAIEPLLKALERTKNSTARVALVESLGYLKCPRALAAILPLAGDSEPEVRLVALEALGRQGDSSATLSLAKALFDPYWQVRVVAIDALTKIGGVAAVDALVLAMARADGRLVHDIVAALRKLTGVDFHDNRVLWRRWWMKNKANYRGPRPAEEKTSAEEPGEPAPDAGTAPPDKASWMERTRGTLFYGIRTRSNRIVFILDISTSMNQRLGPSRSDGTGESSPRKTDQARQELKSSIAALKADATFNIVFYHHEVFVWNPTQVKATPEARTRAAEWAAGLKVDGNTNIFDALERAFRLAGRGTFDRRYQVAADTFFLLSDGMANRGRITNRDAMRREVARLNRYQKVVIHTVALGDDADLEFMRGLAEDSGGQFVHIAGKR